MQLNEIELWLDMQISPAISPYLFSNFGYITKSSYELGMNTETDENIFLRAKERGNIIIITKDKDFTHLIDRFGAPPKIVLLRTGNCSNEAMKRILNTYLLEALEELINTSATLAEIKPANIY